jgi:nucleotide-binding universal stress UspA family protein
MGPIVCVTRGGDVSLRTQKRAIALACEREADLIFLFVADPGFSEPMGQSLAAALADELTRLGNQLLCIARSRANDHKVEAEVTVRNGPARKTIQDFVREVDASALVLGVAHTDLGARSFSMGKVSQIAQDIRTATGVEVLVVE